MMNLSGLSKLAVMASMWFLMLHAQERQVVRINDTWEVDFPPNCTIIYDDVTSAPSAVVDGTLYSCSVYKRSMIGSKDRFDPDSAFAHDSDVEPFWGDTLVSARRFEVDGFPAHEIKTIRARSTGGGFWKSLLGGRIREYNRTVHVVEPDAHYSFKIVYRINSDSLEKEADRFLGSIHRIRQPEPAPTTSWLKVAGWIAGISGTCVVLFWIARRARKSTSR